MKTPEEAFGVVLRRLREEKGISQENLALEGNLDRTFISMLERGKRQPSLTTILNLAKVLGVGEGELVEFVVKEIG
ncbi:MAG: transcriptional regulator [Gammaproteobacteria bacterium]|nr:transcriptional regulator [Gammaproteobacteria bacterium]|tara:strand:- start:2492 stop:2719 length:228 start_codon:yes stop_codon:yes gene_type:complete